MDKVIQVVKRGSFHVGGEKIKLEHVPVEDYPYNGQFTFHSDPNGTHWVKQMYVQYTLLDEPKAPYPVLMWHGGGLTGVTWETTPGWPGGLGHPFSSGGFRCLSLRRRGARTRQLGQISGGKCHAPGVPYL